MAFTFEDEVPSKKTVGSESLRHAKRTGLNVLTQAQGLPGDILSIAHNKLAAPVTRAITGSEEELPYEESFLSRLFPTTEHIRSDYEAQFGEYPKPHDEIEKFADDVVQDAASLLIPGGQTRATTKLGKVTTKLMQSLGSNIVGKSIGEFTDEATGDLAKVGSLLLTSIIDKKPVRSRVNQMFGEAEALVPEGATVDATSLNRNLSHLEHQVTKGRPLSSLSAEEKVVIREINQTRDLIKNGSIDVKQAIAQKRTVNKNTSNLYQEFPNRSQRAGVEKLSKRVGGFLGETINEYGSHHPQFDRLYKSSNQAYATLANSELFTNFVNNFVDTSGLSKGTQALIGAGKLGAAATGAAYAPAYAASGASAYYATRTLYRISQSPTLAKLYGKMMVEGLRENAATFTKYAHQLDKELKKDESKDRWVFEN